MSLGLALGVALLLLSRRPLPDRGLPLRARWLRQLLAVLVVAALVAGAAPGMQLYSSRLPRLPAWALAAVLLWLGKPVVDVLAASSWPARFTAWEEINRLG
jgi:hypothetical protein